MYFSEVIPSFFFVIMSPVGILILGYKQGFLIADLLIAASHFENCVLRSFVESLDNTLQKYVFK